jgi:ribosomal protein S20
MTKQEEQQKIQENLNKIQQFIQKAVKLLQEGDKEKATTNFKLAGGKINNILEVLEF